MDLGEVYSLTRIVLWNRTDGCCVERLSNFRVSILEDADNEVYGVNLFTVAGEFPMTPDTEIILPENTEGQIVRIDILGPNALGEEVLYLSLAEVQVFSGEAIAIPPSIDQQQELELMKQTAYLVNISRGPIVDEAALSTRSVGAR